VTKPNLLFILTDQQRADSLACYGNTHVQVPHLNRLAQGMYLQADPTVQYAMGYQTDTGQWWKTPVTLEEYSQVSSPYNTYLNGGLPPGPIANPGAASINATLQPEQTNYLFFMGCGGEGAHLFAEDYETHQANVAACQ